MIIGIGTDILSTKRIQNLVDKYGNTFLERWFSPEEIRYCQGKNNPSIHFAARMAAKEAVAKSIMIDGKNGIPWKLISVVRDEDGKPSALLSGWLRESAEKKGVKKISLSISHCEEYATATALAEGSMAAAAEF